MTGPDLGMPNHAWKCSTCEGHDTKNCDGESRINKKKKKEKKKTFRENLFFFLVFGHHWSLGLLKYVDLFAGHFGTIKLPATIFHPYFIPEILQILNKVCPGCKSVRHDRETKVRYLPAHTEFLNAWCSNVIVVSLSICNERYLSNWCELENFVEKV